MTQRIVGVDERGLRVGEDHQRATLTDAEVELMRQLREVDGWTYDQLAEKFEVSRRHARDIVNYRKRVTTPVAYRAIG
ncbi:hypothetical protein CAL26_09925 [Bordetella genomosp. 9]|uniref:Uncharacterized protein n=1 Tax=Bordetella genomosp. 9 TaxID=1416803 RepID=A0A261RFD7_9BORD|nr:hypothetical protein [Bordetella genomosp. 9]OZI23739.1 hypothetical protein CAL26_09925 [Bordetella genomosp. 9]